MGIWWFRKGERNDGGAMVRYRSGGGRISEALFLFWL